MGLQLKGGNIVNDNDKSSIASLPESDKENVGKWGDKDLQDNFYQVDLSEMKKDSKRETRQALTMIRNNVLRVIVIIAIVAGVVLGRKYVMSLMNPEIKDITGLVNADENRLSQELGITMSDSGKWMPDILSWMSNKTITVNCDEDIGVYYIDKSRFGIHVHTDKYKLYNIQVGMGDKKALEIMTYQYDNYVLVEADMKEGTNTTYYYYNKAQNDCLGLTLNNTTNLIEGITYVNNYQLFSDQIELNSRMNK